MWMLWDHSEIHCLSFTRTYLLLCILGPYFYCAVCRELTSFKNMYAHILAYGLWTAHGPIYPHPRRVVILNVSSRHGRGRG